MDNEIKDYYIDENSILLASNIFRSIDRISVLNNDNLNSEAKEEIKLCLSVTKESLKVLLEIYENTYDSYLTAKEEIDCLRD